MRVFDQTWTNTRKVLSVSCKPETHSKNKVAPETTKQKRLGSRTKVCVLSGEREYLCIHLWFPAASKPGAKNFDAIHRSPDHT